MSDNQDFVTRISIGRLMEILVNDHGLAQGILAPDDMTAQQLQAVIFSNNMHANAYVLPARLVRLFDPPQSLGQDDLGGTISFFIFSSRYSTYN